MEYVDKKSADNLAAWFLAPHPRVAPAVGSINNAPGGIDTATKAGCKSQSYTSWACFSHAYVCSAANWLGVPAEKSAANKNRRIISKAADASVIAADQPTETVDIPKALWHVMTPEQKEQLQVGKLACHAGLLITPEQAIMLRNMSLSEYTCWMIEEYQIQSASYGVRTLGPDKYDLQKTYDKMNEMTVQMLRIQANDMKQSKTSASTTQPTPTTSSTTTTPTAPQTTTSNTTSTTKKPTGKTQKNARQRRDVMGDELDEIDALIAAADELGLTNEAVKEMMSDTPNAVELMMADAKTGTTSTGGIPFSTMAPSIAQYSLTMQRERARVIEETYTKIKDNKDKKIIPVRRPKKYDANTAARMLYNRRREAVKNQNIEGSPYDKPISKNHLANLANLLVNRELHRSEKDTSDIRAQNQTTTTTTPKSVENKYDVNILRKTRDTAGDGRWSADWVPMRLCQNSTYPPLYEQDIPIPYSPLYKNLEARLVDPTATGALGSLVRAPNVRDATSMLTLVKAIRFNPGSVMDIAPIMRVSLLSTSLDPELAYHDPTIMQCFHNANRTTANVRIVDIPDHMVTRPNGQMIAMTLDTFCTYMSNSLLQAAAPDEFHPTRIDTNWCAIPMRGALAAQSYASSYIMSFLDSKYTMGSVNWRYTVYYTDVHTGQTDESYEEKPRKLSTIPASNTIHIPGPISAVIVLTDYTSANLGNVRVVNIDGQNIPIYTGQVPVVPVQIRDFWNLRYTNDTMLHVRRDLAFAYNEMVARLAVHNTNSIALAMTSECYGASRPGILARPAAEGGFMDYDFNNPCPGAMVLSTDPTAPHVDPVAPLYYQSRLKASQFGQADLFANPEDDTDSPICGFNFAAISSHHLMPSGYVDGIDIDNMPVDNGWQQWGADLNNITDVPTYNVTSASSLNRVGIYCGLIATNTDTIEFKTPAALATWVHMLSTAQSANTANFLTNNNIIVADWSGWRELYEDMYLNQILTTAKQNIFSGFVVHQPVWRTAITGGWETPTVRQMTAMYPHVNVELDMDWYSASPTPTHFLLQWVQKLKLENYPAIPQPKYYGIGPMSMRAIPIERDTCGTKTQIYSTIDFERYRPRMTYVDTAIHNMGMWIDFYSHMSMYSSSAPVATQRSFLATAATTMTPARIDLPYVDDSKLFVRGSSAELVASANDVIRTSNIVFPDPPSFESILTAAKNYVLGPATAGLMGMLAAGPTGAAVGAGADLARQAIEDLIKSKKQNDEAEALRRRADEEIERQRHAAAQTQAVTADPLQPTAVDGPTTM